MSDNQTIKLICKGCRDILDEPSNLSIEERKPCPKCGSILRNHEVVITCSVPTIHVQAKLAVFEEGAKDFSVEVRQGDDLYRKTGEWRTLQRRIDRKNDRYKKVVTDPKTGEILYECDEPLSEHQGHGDAKFSKRKKNDSGV